MYFHGPRKAAAVQKIEASPTTKLVKVSWGGGRYRVTIVGYNVYGGTGKKHCVQTHYDALLMAILSKVQLHNILYISHLGC